MNVRMRILAPCGEFLPESARVQVDMDILVRNMLLFKTYILQSTRLLEIDGLVKRLGAGGVRELLQSSALKIHCDAYTVGQTGQTATPLRLSKGIIPLNSFCVQTVRMAHWEEYFQGCLKQVNGLPNVNYREASKLKKAIVDALVPRQPDSDGREALETFYKDLDQNALVQKAISVAIQHIQRVDISPKRVIAKVFRIDDEDFKIESNLRELLGCDQVREHVILERAVLGLAGVSLRISEMRHYNALSGVLEEDLFLMMSKFDTLAREMAPQLTERRFARVLALADIPMIPENASISASTLLKVRDTPECAEFRDWLHGIDELDDKELKHYLTGFQHRFAQAFQSIPGKALRLVATTALGLLPGGLAVGTASSALDVWLGDKVFRESGPSAFVHRLFPSLFRN